LQTIISVKFSAQGQTQFYCHFQFIIYFTFHLSS